MRLGNFYKLWSAQILELVGSYLLNFILIIAVYDATRGSDFNTLAVSLVVVAFTLPAFFISPLAGALADYWNRRSIMFVVNVLRIFLALLFIPAGSSVLLIVVLALAFSTVTQFFIPAEAATIPMLVPKQKLVWANSLFVMSIYVTFIIGFILTGASIAAFDINGSYIITVITFIVAALLIWWLPRQSISSLTPQKPEINPITQLRINWRLVTQRPERFFSVLLIGIVQALTYILITVAPAISQTVFKSDLQHNSLLFITPIGLGMLIGILIANKLPTRLRITHTILAALGILGASLIAFGLVFILEKSGEVTTTIIKPSLLAYIFIFGLTNALITTLAQTLLQTSTDNTNRGRVLGSLQMLIGLGAALPIFITGFITDFFGLDKFLFILGLAIILVTFGFLSRINRYSASRIRP